MIVLILLKNIIIFKNLKFILFLNYLKYSVKNIKINK